MHMRCAAHILNLIVKDGLEVIKNSIAKIRESVAFWTATPKRVEKFEEIAKHVKVKTEHKLGLDCKTRWNSTYKMLSIALPYKAVLTVQHVLRNYLIVLLVKKNGNLLGKWLVGSSCLMTSLKYFLEQIM